MFKNNWTKVNIHILTLSQRFKATSNFFLWNKMRCIWHDSYHRLFSYLNVYRNKTAVAYICSLYICSLYICSRHPRAGRTIVIRFICGVRIFTGVLDWAASSGVMIGCHNGSFEPAITIHFWDNCPEKGERISFKGTRKLCRSLNTAMCLSKYQHFWRSLFSRMKKFRFSRKMLLVDLSFWLYTNSKNVKVV